LNPRPLGYEPYDVRLRRLGESLVTALAWADVRREVVSGLLRLPISSRLAAFGLQIGLQNRIMACGFLSFDRSRNPCSAPP